MKRLWNVLVLTLALNFLAVAGGAGWLWSRGAIDREKVQAVRQILFPAPDPVELAEDEARAGEAAATTQPSLRLEELLARHAGRPAGEQAQFLQSAFDAQMALLDRRQRELDDLNRQVEMAKEQVARDRARLDADGAALAAEREEAQRLAADQGFQDSLKLYTSMPARQVKQIFLALEDDVIVSYFQAMQPRTAAKIIREFKSAEETGRVQSILEKMRAGGGVPPELAEASTKE